MADFRFVTIDETAVIIRPLTNRGVAWLRRHVEFRAVENGDYLVDAAATPAIAAAAARDGLSVRRVTR